MPRQSTALWVCLPADCEHGSVSAEFALSKADSGRRALSALRLLPFDLVVTGLQLPDMTPWEFIAAMRARWPRQRWALLAPQLDPADEIWARTLGVLAILETPGDVAAVHGALRTTNAGNCPTWLTPAGSLNEESCVG